MLVVEPLFCWKEKKKQQKKILCVVGVKRDNLVRVWKHSNGTRSKASADKYTVTGMCSIVWRLLTLKLMQFNLTASMIRSQTIGHITVKNLCLNGD